MNNSLIVARVTKEHRGARLLSFLSHYVGGAVSTKGIKRAIDARLCRVNGVVEYFSTHPLKEGDKVELRLDPVQKPKILEPTILYDDEHMLICNKPAGVISDARSFSFKACILVHRLDKDTSGALVFAKSSSVYEILCRQFRQREVQKSYLAVVDGKVSAPSGKMEDYLVKRRHYQGQTIWGISSKKEGLYALTHWKRVKVFQNATVLLCRPVTGRMHQLRVQLHAIGHPILGDYQYSRTFSYPGSLERHLLHAESISMSHPVTQKNLQIIAPVERCDMQPFLNTMQKKYC